MRKYEEACKKLRSEYKSGNSSFSYIRKYTVKLYLTQEQKEQANQEIGNFRYIYNYTLGYLWSKFENKEDISISGYDLQKLLLNRLSSEYDWITLSSAQSNQKAVYEAREAFWKLLKNAKITIAKRKAKGKSRPIRPRFKRKHEARQSYYVSNQMCKFKNLDLKDRTLSISKLNKVKFYYRSIPHEDRIIDIRESRLTRINDDYYLSLTVSIARDFSMRKTSKPIGIDWGIHNLLTISDGKHEDTVSNFIKHTKHGKVTKLQNSEITRLQDKIAFLNKIIDRKVKINKKRKLEDPYHTKNIQKLRAKVYEYYRRISNIKTDYLNKAVCSIVKKHPNYIQIEDLKVSEQVEKFPEAAVKDKRLRKFILGTSPYQFKEKLTSACIRERIELRLIPTEFPSTQQCSNCGELNQIDLSQRTYKCPHCGLKIDRDANAAKNILACKDYTVLVDAFGNLAG